MGFMRDSNRIFSRFIIGKTINSAIIAVASFIIYSVMGVITGMPLAPFLALVAGVTNMIPYFGPVIGGVITVLILLCFNPIYALYALIIVIALQAFDAWYLSPKILGDRVGISPLLIIIAVTVGGDVAGFFGMFFGIPLVAVLKLLVYDPLVKKRLAAKKIAMEPENNTDEGENAE